VTGILIKQDAASNAVKNVPELSNSIPETGEQRDCR